MGAVLRIMRSVSECSDIKRATIDVPDSCEVDVCNKMYLAFFLENIIMDSNVRICKH